MTDLVVEPGSTYGSILGPVRSRLPLPVAGGRADVGTAWTLTVGASVTAPSATEHPAVNRRGGLVEMVFGGTAVARVDLASRTIDILPSPSLANSDLAALVVDQILPRIASESSLVLHGGAVVDTDDQAAILVVGASGAGKSTLVTRWCLDGCKLLADDTVRIDGATAACSFVGPRLWPGSLEALGIRDGDDSPATSGWKRRLGPADGVGLADQPAGIRRIVLLGAAPASSRRLAAVRLLCEQALNLGEFDPVRLLDRVTALVNAVPEIEVRPAWSSAPN